MSAATLEVEPDGSAKGWVKTEVIGFEAVRAGEDIDACRKEPNARVLSLFQSLSSKAAAPRTGGKGGTGEGVETSLPGRRNETLDSIFDLAFSFSFELSTSAALPFPFPSPCESTPDSSAGGAGAFALDRVAVRNVCSKDDRRRPNVFCGGSGVCICSRDDDAAGALLVSTCLAMKGLENVMFSFDDGRTAAAM